MSVDDLFLVDVLEGSARVVEIEEEQMCIQLIGFSDAAHQLVQIDLAALVHLDVPL